jgi:polysaccharide biosynthesis protein VpsQ
MRCSTRRRVRVALVAFVVVLAGLVLLADAGRGRWLFRLADWVPGGDKTGHFVLFGFLAFLVNVVMHGSGWRIGRLTLLHGSGIAALVALAEEVSQLGFAARTFDLFDLAAGFAGILLLGRLALLFLKRERTLAARTVRHQ